MDIYYLVFDSGRETR